MSCSLEILLSITLTFLITIVIVAVIAILFLQLFYTKIKMDLTFDFTNSVDKFCTKIPETIIYRRELVVPVTNGTYQRSLAIPLLDISLAVTESNCSKVLPLPNPRPLDNQLRVEGVDPISGQTLMFAYIFWSVDTGQAVIAFTGTSYNSEWVSDFQFDQVPPTQLDGYSQGMLVHRGFYNIYLAVRDQLWTWYRDNADWIQYFYITGHSLGGALSCLCAFDFGQVRIEQNEYPIHYSFASPRVGNVLYAETFNERIPTSIRVNNTEDAVPQLPLSAWRGLIYEHTSQNVPFTSAQDSLLADHVTAYILDMPACPQVAPC